MEGLFPGLVRCQTGGAVEMSLVVVVDFTLEQLIGLIHIPDFFVSQESDQAFLECAKEPFDLALGLG